MPPRCKTLILNLFPSKCPQWFLVESSTRLWRALQSLNHQTHPQFSGLDFDWKSHQVQTTEKAQQKKLTKTLFCIFRFSFLSMTCLTSFCSLFSLSVRGKQLPLESSLQKVYLKWGKPPGLLWHCEKNQKPHQWCGCPVGSPLKFVRKDRQDLSKTFVFLFKCCLHWRFRNAQPYDLEPSNSCN